MDALLVDVDAELDDAVVKWCIVKGDTKSKKDIRSTEGGLRVRPLRG